MFCMYIYMYAFYDTLYEHNFVSTRLPPTSSAIWFVLFAIVFVVFPLPLQWRKIASCFQFYYFSYFSTLLFMLLNIMVLLLLLLLFHFQVHSGILVVLLLFLLFCFILFIFLQHSVGNAAARHFVGVWLQHFVAIRPSSGNISAAPTTTHK